jgi:hypothetical protein
MSRQFELGKAPPEAPGTNLKTLENPTMSDNMNKGFDQVAAFQKLWTDSFANMTDVWSQFSPGSPPSDEIRKMRGGMLKVLAETWDEYMRTPQFMEMMKASLNGALDLKRMARDGMNRVHEQFETPSKEDIDGVLLAIRHVEGRLLDRLEGLDDRVVNLNEKIDKIDQRIAKQEHAIDERVANLNEKIDKVDERTAQQENAIQRRGQTSKTKAQKPEATAGAKHSHDK